MLDPITDFKYTVQEGDTLSSLAQLFYDDPEQWETILEANPDLQDVGPDDPLPAEIQLLIPPREQEIPSPTERDARFPFPPDPSSQRRSVTRSGDTLASIAQAIYGDRNRWPALKQRNPIFSPYGPDDPLPGGIPFSA